MDDLNAQQIVLLTLLVSFVTSIATGITTVSLLEQAPEPITQTINRVVEKTVERVIEVSDENNTPVEKIVETVVINAEDLTIEAVEKNSNSVVRIYNKIGQNKLFVGLGLIVDEGGTVLVDSKSIINNDDYIGEYPGGSEKELQIKFKQSNNTFALLKISGENTEKFTVANIGDSQNIKLGQSIISLSGQNNDVVATGIITSLNTVEVTPPAGSEDSSTRVVVNAIDTSLNTALLSNGSILLNLRGELIGIKIGVNQNTVATFIPSKQIKDFLSSEAVKN